MVLGQCTSFPLPPINALIVFTISKQYIINYPLVIGSLYKYVFINVTNNYESGCLFFQWSSIHKEVVDAYMVAYQPTINATTCICIQVSKSNLFKQHFPIEQQLTPTLLPSWRSM